MAKKWYHYLVTSEDHAEASATGPDAIVADDPSAPVPVADTTVGSASTLAGLPSFDDIYAAARIAAPPHGYTILKIADMLRSEHIAALPPDVKKKSILVALDAAGVSLDAIVADAVQRDRALDAFERAHEKALQAFEAKAQADQQQWQREIDDLIAEKQAKIRAASEALAKETAAVRAWRESKAAEEARIADAVGHFLDENPITIGQPPAKPSSKP